MNLYGFTPDDIKTLRALRYGKETDAELEALLHEASRRKLDPLTGQIHLIVRKDNRDGVSKPTIQTGIDGLRLLAERTNEYRGQTTPLWCGEDGKWVDVWLGKGPPLAAKVGVYREGFSEPLIAVAKWSAYGSEQMMWRKMPDHMLAKVAEALALRKAFPEQMSGLYSDEEMDQADKKLPTTAVPPEPAQPKTEPQSEKTEPNNPITPLGEYVGEVIKGTGGEIISPLADDVTYTKLLETLISGTNGIDPAWSIPYARARLDKWKSNPKDLHDKRAIWEQALLESKRIRDLFTTDVDDLLRERALSRDEAKALLDITSFTDLLTDKAPTKKAIGDQLDAALKAKVQ